MEESTEPGSVEESTESSPWQTEDPHNCGQIVNQPNLARDKLWTNCGPVVKLHSGSVEESTRGTRTVVP